MKKIISLALICFSASLYGQVTGKLIWGTVYNIFHDEYSTDQEFFQQVDIDIAAIKKANLDYLLIFPMGQWDSDKKEMKWERTDYLIKKIEQAKLYFVPVMLKEEQCSHYFPIWKFKEIDGLWNTHNQRNKSRNNRENVDFADPKILPVLEKYISEVVLRYGKSPALGFYNLWNEPHYSSEAEHVVDKFREWLKQKYGSLSKLNRIWGDDYTEWNEVTPFLNDNWNSSMPQIDWIMFRNELNGNLLGLLKSIIRKYDPVHQINSNPVGTPWADFSGFGGYSTDNWVFTKNNDINGSSYYPDGWERGNNMADYPAWLHNLAFNTIRSASADKDYILTEMFTNVQNGLALNGYLNKTSSANIAWTALSNDCKGIIFWKWEPFRRGRQSLGRGLTTLDGELASRGEAVKEIGRILNDYGSVLLKARLNKPEVALLMDMTGLLKTLEQSTETATVKFMYESNAGLFKALSEENILSDLLRMDMSLTLEKLKQYKIIFLPFQIVIRKEMADLLKQFVQQGGCVVADARTGTIDENDLAYRISPGAGLDELFGARSKDWTAKKGSYIVNFRPAPESMECTFEGKYFRDQLITAENSQIIGRFSDDGSPAITVNNFGKGRAIFSAVPLGASYYNNESNKVKQVILDIVKYAGLSPSAKFISKDKQFLDIKIHSSKNERVIYAINHEDIEKNGTIEINCPKFKAGQVINIMTGKDMEFHQDEGVLQLNVSIAKNEVQVFIVK